MRQSAVADRGSGRRSATISLLSLVIRGRKFSPLSHLYAERRSLCARRHSRRRKKPDRPSGHLRSSILWERCCSRQDRPRCPAPAPQKASLGNFSLGASLLLHHPTVPLPGVAASIVVCSTA